MNELVWFRSYVERMLQEIWDGGEVQEDSDGDYAFRFGTAACWVSIEPGPWMAVRVTAHAAHGVKRTVKLLAELNDITARTRFGDVYWSGGVVVCEYALPAPGLDKDRLRWACRLIGSQADELGALLAVVYGGHTPFEPEAAPDADRRSP